MTDNKMTADSEAYQVVMEEIAAKYAPKAIALLNKIGDILKENGFAVVTAPFDFSADDYEYRMLITSDPEDPGNTDKQVDISVEIAEQASYEGPAIETPGLNFGLHIVEYGGLILGGLTPFNYSDQCWVPVTDNEAIAARWQILEDADIDDIPSLISNHDK